MSSVLVQSTGFNKLSLIQSLIIGGKPIFLKYRHQWFSVWPMCRKRDFNFKAKQTFILTASERQFIFTLPSLFNSSVKYLIREMVPSNQPPRYQHRPSKNQYRSTTIYNCSQFTNLIKYIQKMQKIEGICVVVQCKVVTAY